MTFAQNNHLNYSLPFLSDKEFAKTPPAQVSAEHQRKPAYLKPNSGVDCKKYSGV
jgi:hypothetical protein